jgi:glycerol-3-phosphate O-acyltransferase
LYHAVLSRYVQLITRNGVTQGIFPEGGLTRDGKLQTPKIGLLDYALQVATNPKAREQMVVVPVAINYDRVLEDRSLLRELAIREGRRRPSRVVQIGEVLRYVGMNVGRLLLGRWQRYGRAAVTIGAPTRVADWLDSLGAQGVDLFALERSERLALVQEYCNGLMERVGALVPVTPVPLACAALQTFDSEFVPREALLARMSELREVLPEINALPLRVDRTIEEVFDRAWLMLRMRRVLASQGDMFVILPRGRELISYYANSVAHLLGPYAEGVRGRDALPAIGQTRGLG